MRRCRSRMRTQTACDSVCDSLCDIVCDTVSHAVWDTVWDAVCDAVWRVNMRPDSHCCVTRSSRLRIARLVAPGAGVLFGAGAVWLLASVFSLWFCPGGSMWHT
jgi:hypothetical protein